MTFSGLFNSHLDGNTYTVYLTDDNEVTYRLWKDLTKEQKQYLKESLAPWQIQLLKGRLQPFLTDIKVCTKQIWRFSGMMHRTLIESGEHESILGKALEGAMAANLELSERILFDSLSLVTEQTLEPESLPWLQE
jgi:hypothetical protein